MFKQTNKIRSNSASFKPQIASDFLFLCLFSLKLVCFKTNPNAGLFAVVKIPFASVCCTAQSKGNGDGMERADTLAAPRPPKEEGRPRQVTNSPTEVQSPHNCQLYPIRCPVVSSSLAICKCNAIPKKY